MATSGNRDVKLTVEAQALGAEAIKDLANTVRSLGKEGADAAPEFDRLAGELNRIADQSKSVQSLKALEVEIEALTAAQANAAIKAEGTKAAYDGQKAATDALRASVADATAEWNKARLAQVDAKQALDNTKLSLVGLTREQALTNVELKAGKQGAIDATAEQKRLKVALDETKQALAESVSGESAAATAYRKSASEIARAETALRTRTNALTDAQEAGAKLGVETTNLAGAEARLRAELADTAAAAEKTQAYVNALAEIDRQALQVTLELADALKRNAQAYTDDAASAKLAAEAASLVAAAQQAAAESALQFVLSEEKAAAVAGQVAKRFAEIDAAAEKLKADEAYVREFAAALDAADARALALANATKALATAADAAAVALPNAFNAAGVRSIAAIQAEIVQTSQAVHFLEQGFASGAVSAYDLARATGSAEARMQALRTEMSTLPAAVGVLERMNESVLGLVNRFGALTAALATAGFAIKPILDANLALDSMTRVLTTVNGSAAEAGKQIDFVRRVANDAGLDVTKAGEAFTLFAASAKASGLSTELVEKVFSATANAAGNLGLSSDKTTHILEALGQMANKGTVSMEELRQQLGDSLPGALSLLAKGLGITEPQLVKLVTSGKLLTSEALGPLAEAMVALGAPGGHVEGLRAAMSRLGNQFTLAYQSISDTAFYRGLTSVIGGLATNFDALRTSAVLLFEVLAVGKLVTIITNFLGLNAATVSATQAMTAAAVAAEVEAAALARTTVAAGANAAAMGSVAAASTAAAAASTVNAGALAGASAGIAGVGAAAVATEARVGLLARAAGGLAVAGRGLMAALGGPLGVMVSLGIAAYELGPAIGRLAAEFLGFKDRTAEVTVELKAAEQAAKAGAAARDVDASSLVRIKVLYAEHAQALAVSTAAAEKLAKAVKDQGDAAVHAAELSGDEATKLAAVTRARELDTVALEGVAVKKRAEADATEKLISAQEKSLVGRGRLDVAQQRELAQLREKVDLVGKLTDQEKLRLAELIRGEEEAAKAIASTVEQIRVDREKLEGQRAASIEADAAVEKQKALADSAAQAASVFRDNAASLNTLRAAYVAAKARSDDLQKGVELGVISQEKAAAATLATAKALGLYRDAANDAVQAQQRLIASQSEASALRQQSISIDRVRIETDLKIADLTGQYSDKLDAQIKLKGLDIQATRETVAAANLNAAALREEARLKAEVLLASDANYAAKKREIDALNNSAKSIENTARIERERLRMLEIEQGILNGTLYKGAAGFGELSAAADAATAAALRYGSALQKTTYDAEKFAESAKGVRLAIAAGDGSTYTPASASDPVAKAQADFDAAAANYQRLQGNAGSGRAVNGAPIQTTGVSPQFAQLQRDTVQAAALDAFRAFEAANKALTAAKAGVAPATTAGAVNGGYEIRFVLGGTTRTVIAPTKSDAEALVKDLEAAFKAAGGG